MIRFNELKEKMDEISKIVEQYPDNLKESVFKLLIESLGLNTGKSDSSNIDSDTNIKNKGSKIFDNKIVKKSTSKKKPTIVKMVDDRNLVTNEQCLKDFINERNLTTNVKFITAIVYFLNNNLGIQNVDDAYIMTCYKLCGREIGNISASIQNCINRNQYLTRNEEGFYVVTAFGDNLVTIKSLKK